VAMNTVDYYNACWDTLKDTTHYQPYTDKCWDVTYAPDHTDFILKHMHDMSMITDGSLGACLSTHGKHKDRPFFGLPKVHKPTDKWRHIIPPLRPIISDCPSATYQAGRLLDTFLQPISVKHPSYVQNTQHLLQLLTTVHLPQQYTLFTSDVESLYTNIPHMQGLQAVKNALFAQLGPEQAKQIQLICRLLHIQMTTNVFTMDEHKYIQTQGIAMGKSWAPSVANIFMAEWERQLATATQHLPQPLLWRRYIDDIFGIYPGDLTDTGLHGHRQPTPPRHQAGHHIQSQSSGFSGPGHLR
jgi:hypothetical protein